MMALFSGVWSYVAAAGGFVALLGGVALWFRRSGAQAQTQADQQKAVRDAQTRVKVDASVDAESDAAVADDLRKQRNQ